MNSSGIWIRKSFVLAVGALCLALAASISAQVQTQTSTATGKTTKEVAIENGEVVAVEGNSLFVKMSDGTLRDFPNVPENAKVTVDGQQLGIHELKPGMKLQRTTVTSTTPQVVTTIETVTGKVWHITPPLSVILTMENGENQQFKIPDGQKFMVDGRETDAWGLKKGMKVTAMRITETPLTLTSQHTQVTGTMSADEAVLIAKGRWKEWRRNHCRNHHRNYHHCFESIAEDSDRLASCGNPWAVINFDFARNVIAPQEPGTARLGVRPSSGRRFNGTASARAVSGKRLTPLAALQVRDVSS